MPEINVGHGAEYSGSSTTPKSYIDAENPANDTGVLDTVEVFVSSNTTTFLFGTMTGSGITFKARDTVSIGSVTSGAKRTFTGLNCEVSSGDYAGCYHANGKVCFRTGGGVGLWINNLGDYLSDKADHTYGEFKANYCIAIYATGETVAAGSKAFIHHYKHLMAGGVGRQC